MVPFVLSFAVALIGAWIATPLVRRVALRVGVADDPGVRKLHKTAIPNIGGAAFVAAMLLGTAVFWFSSETARVAAVDRRVWFGLVAVLVMFGVGFVDDLRGVRVRYKFLAQIVVALGLCAVDVRIDAINLAGRMVEFPFPVSWAITVLWLVGVTNAVNLIDGIDGLAASLSAIACGALAILGFQFGEPLLAATSLAMLGGLVGFLFFNFHPARIFMGDGGSLALGMFLGAGAIFSLQSAARFNYHAFAIPALALGIPILDATYCVVRRILDRRSPFAPDRGHIHHRLLDLGLGHRQINLLLVGVTVLSTGIGMAMLSFRMTAQMVVFVAAASVPFAFLWGVGYFRFRRTLRSLWQMHALGRERRHAQRAFEDLQLKMREANRFDDWWAVVCEAAEEWDFASVDLTVQRREAGPRDLTWRAAEQEREGETLTVEVPIAQRRAGQPLTARASLWTNGSLEGAAERFRLFARLVDEHSIQSLLPEPGTRATAGGNGSESPRP